MAIRDNPDHVAQVSNQGIEFIDLVVSNLYPFEETIATKGVELAEAIENIDIGGPSMIRAAAKNYNDVAILTNPQQYPEVIAELDTNDGCLSGDTRFRLAKAAFAHTAHYDTAISRYLANLAAQDADFPDLLNLQYESAQSLRYGENPHQRAAFYRTHATPEPCAAWANQLSGQPLSFNNILDLEAAIEIVKDFSEPTCVINQAQQPVRFSSRGQFGGGIQRCP